VPRILTGRVIFGNALLESRVGNPKRIRDVGLTSIDRVYPKGYRWRTVEVRKTEVFVRWLDGLGDIRARARVLARIERLAAGNPGDAEPVGEGVSELRIDHGPGYRVYYKQQGREWVILLAGGDKSTQSRDIRAARRLARNLSDDP
jgi:putative addiction module killer protein